MLPLGIGEMEEERGESWSPCCVKAFRGSFLGEEQEPKRGIGMKLFESIQTMHRSLLLNEAFLSPRPSRARRTGYLGITCGS